MTETAETHAPATHPIVTRSGLKLDVRPAGEKDGAILEDFFRHVTAEDLRFRFLSGMPRVPAEEIFQMTHVDHHRREMFLGFEQESGQLIATAMLGCDAALERGEVAIAIRAGFKDRGIGWSLLRYVAEVAEQRGVQAIESIESRENHAAIELEREMGFSAESYEGDPSLVLLRKALVPAARHP